MTTQNTPGDGSHPDIPGSNNGPTIGPIAVRRRSTWLSPAHRYRVHPAWPQEGGPGPNLPLRGPLKSIRGAVPKQQPRERERGSSYSARRDNVDNNAMANANCAYNDLYTHHLGHDGPYEGWTESRTSPTRSEGGED